MNPSRRFDAVRWITAWWWFALCFSSLAHADVAETTHCTPQVISVQAARAALNDEVRPTQGWEPVTLPDLWTRRWPDHTGTVWYRIDWDRGCVAGNATPAKDAQDYAPIGLGLGGINMAGAVYLNDSLLWSDRSLTKPLSQSWNVPRWWTLPTAALKERVNTVWVRVVGAAELAPGLGQLNLGTAAHVEKQHARMLWRQRTAFVMAAVLSGVLGAVFFVVWFLRRQERAFGWYALTSLWWTVYLSTLLATSTWQVWPIYDPSDPQFTGTLNMSRLNLTALVLYTLCFGIFTFRFCAQKLPRVERLLCTLAALGVGTILLVPRTHIEAASKVIVLTTALIFLLHCVQVQWRAWRTRNAQHVLLAVCCTVFLVVAVHDIYTVFRSWSAHEGWMPLSTLATTMFVALLLGVRLAASTRQVEQFNQELEAGIAKARNELAQALAREYTRNLEHTRLQERVQLAHDLHDGIGGSLVRSIAIVEQAQRARKPLANERVLSLLKMLRDDLRQMIDFGSSTGTAVAATPDQWIAPLRHRFTRIFDELQIPWEWDCDLEWRSELHRPSAMQCLSLARIMEEALSNSIKHSQARSIRVSCQQPSPDTLIIRMEDEGLGFKPESAQDASGFSVGMRSMAARARRIGASLRVDSTLGQGTVVTVELALDSPISATLGRPSAFQNL